MSGTRVATPKCNVTGVGTGPQTSYNTLNYILARVSVTVETQIANDRYSGSLITFIFQSMIRSSLGCDASLDRQNRWMIYHPRGG